jgi:hypothetical protein
MKKFEILSFYPRKDAMNEKPSHAIAPLMFRRFPQGYIDNF